MTRLERAAQAVRDYIELPDAKLETVEDTEHPQHPVAVRVTRVVAGSFCVELYGDFLVHQPYTWETVEEVQFTSWPPAARR